MTCPGGCGGRRAEAARQILAAAGAVIAERAVFRILLSAGHTPTQTDRMLAEAEAEADWTGWHIYFRDKRCLPPGHAERNSLAAAQAWLDRVSIPAENVHPIPAGLGAEA
jgi:6-phosphogluconolactonase